MGIKFVVGLGNPDGHYQNTRHNVGRREAESFLKLGPHPLGIKFFVTEGYMNTSGKEVNRYMKRHGVSNEETLIVLDDFEIPLGKIRIRLSGSDGGHNGLKSVIEEVQSQNIPRLRIGI